MSVCPPAHEQHTCLAEDIPCVQCEYNLRGLMPEGLCPECGTSIASSLAEHARWMGNTVMLPQARRGLRFLIGSQAIWLAAASLMLPFLWHGSDAFLMSMLCLSGNRPWAMAGTLETNEVPRWLLGAAGLSSLTLQFLGGYWLMRTRMPRESTTRRRMRLIALLGLLGSPAVLVLGAATFLVVGEKFGSVSWERLMTVLMLVDVPIPLLMGRHCGELARMLRRTVLRHSIVLCGLGVALANLLSSVHATAFVLTGTGRTVMAVVVGVFALAAFNALWLGTMVWLAWAPRTRANP